MPICVSLSGPLAKSAILPSFYRPTKNNMNDGKEDGIRTTGGPTRRRSRAREERQQEYMKRNATIEKFLTTTCYMWHPTSWLPFESYHEPNVSLLLKRLKKATGLAVTPHTLSMRIKEMWCRQGATAEQAERLRRHNRPGEYYGVQMRQGQARQLDTEPKSSLEGSGSMRAVHRGKQRIHVQFTLTPHPNKKKKEEARLMVRMTLKDKTWPTCRLDAKDNALRIQSDNGDEIDSILTWPKNVQTMGKLHVRVQPHGLFVLTACRLLHTANETRNTPAQAIKSDVIVID